MLIKLIDAIPIPYARNLFKDKKQVDKNKIQGKITGAR
jgi:hypothetical protein